MEKMGAGKGKTRRVKSLSVLTWSDRQRENYTDSEDFAREFIEQTPVGKGLGVNADKNFLQLACLQDAREYLTTNGTLSFVLELGSNLGNKETAPAVAHALEDLINQDPEVLSDVEKATAYAGKGSAVIAVHCLISAPDYLAAMKKGRMIADRVRKQWRCGPGRSLRAWQAHVPTPASLKKLKSE